MKQIFLFCSFVMLSSCMTIYKSDLAVRSVFPGNEGRSYQLTIGQDKTIHSGNMEPTLSEIPVDTQEKLKSEIQSRISNQCAESRGIKNLEVSFETKIDLDRTCWVFTLCYVVVPGMLTGTQRIKVKINQSENLYLKEAITYRSYAHILLIPALIYKPFDQRGTQAKIKLLESLSDNLCSNQKVETFLGSN